MIEWYFPWGAVDWVLKVQLVLWISVIVWAVWISWRTLVLRRPWLRGTKRK